MGFEKSSGTILNEGAEQGCAALIPPSSPSNVINRPSGGLFICLIGDQESKVGFDQSP